ncbi:MAG: isopeptide-forming domain-containing fimbrial protein [Ruminococcus sp.]|nr:isopeptide-forming domain-containing fimbrial protein [Ruminococcus sp.]
MKNTKRARRAAAFAAAVVMAACAAVPMGSSFSASAVGTGKITITDGSGATSSTMAAFQIFTAKVSGESVVVTGWGDGIALNTLSDAIAASDLSSDFTGVNFENTEASAQKVADIVSGYTGNYATKAETFAKLAAQSKQGEGTAAVGNVIEGLNTGYYIVIDTEAASNGNYTSFTLGMLTVVTGENATATVKRDFPSFDKQIGDINDTTDVKDTYTFNEAADHDMGDAVPFKLIASVPSNIAKYDTYKMIFHDDLQKDVFTFNSDSVKVKYYTSSSDTNGTDVTGSFTVSTTGLAENDKFDKSHTDGTEDFTVTCNNIKEISGITLSGDGHFEIQYTATLTTNAKMGAEGNWNGAYLEYSNNPNVSGEGDTDNTGKSPTDYCVAFTYQTVIDKIDGITKAPLTGAEFTLEKKLKDGTTKTVQVVTALEGTRFMFNGLDDGTYVLTESKVPDKYNGIEPITFTISATEDQTDGSEALTSLTADGGARATFTSGKVYLLNDTTEATGSDNGSVKTTIENLKGSSLPSTGGIGTTMFYVGGGVLVAGAGVLLITKKRAKKDAE